jgi:hypothetical protein
MTTFGIEGRGKGRLSKNQSVLKVFRDMLAVNSTVRVKVPCNPFQYIRCVGA